MQANGCRKSGRGRASWRVGFAVLWAALALALAESGASAAPTETVLHSFTGGVGDGILPIAGLIADRAGNLYGTTSEGGGSGCNGPGCGVVFKLSPGGIETVLHSFAGGDGALPIAGLIADRAGNLYGTTSEGGGSDRGVVFKLAPNGTETVLYSFCSLPSCSDGAGPSAGLIADRAGNLYGTTYEGGGSGCNGPGCGVVFKLAPPIPPATKWTETVLHSFTGSDGAGPSAGLIADSSGNLYGTASGGGGPDRGVVFKLAPNGTETVLYSFCSLPSCSDGAGPSAGLIADSSGNLYGTTYGGGSECIYGPECGVVFKLSPGGAETVLHSFTGGVGAGILPIAGLIADASGNLYGTTSGGGATGCPPPGCGVVFKLAPPIPPATKWTETVLHSFTGSDGAGPSAGLIADSSGNLYGTASGDGPSRIGGVVFELAGTGFVTATPFLAFSAQLQMDVNAKPAKDAFALESSFTLSSTAPAISPLTQAVALKVGPFSATLPAGSFKQTGPLFTFAGVVNGINLQALITPTGTLRYAFAAAAEHPNLTGTTNPVPVTLTIGGDSGATSVTAMIFH